MYDVAFYWGYLIEIVIDDKFHNCKIIGENIEIFVIVIDENNYNCNCN